MRCYPRHAARTEGLQIREQLPNLPTKIVDFKGFDSNIILMLRGGILKSIENFLEFVSQAILAGIILVGRLGAAILGISCTGNSGLLAGPLKVGTRTDTRTFHIQFPSKDLQTNSPQDQIRLKNDLSASDNPFEHTT